MLGLVSLGSRPKVRERRDPSPPGWLLLFGRRQRPQEAKLSVYRVLAAVVSERAAGLLLFRRHFLILATRVHETLPEEVSMTDRKRYQKLADHPELCWKNCLAAVVFNGYFYFFYFYFYIAYWQSMFFENMFIRAWLKVPKLAIS